MCICMQTNFHNVNANNTSSGLREKLYLPILAPKYGGKILHQCNGEGEESLLGGPYLPDGVHMSPYRKDGPCDTLERVGKGGYHRRWRAGVSYSTPSQMLASWYFPRFLFRGSLTLM